MTDDVNDANNAGHWLKLDWTKARSHGTLPDERTFH